MNWFNDIRDLPAAAVTALLYIAPLVSIPLCILYFVKKRRLWAWLWGAVAAVSLAPLAAFLVVYYNSMTFPDRRAAELASLQRGAIPKGERPHSLAVVGDAGNSSRLLAVGVLDAIVQYPDGIAWPRKLLFTPKRAESCIEQNIAPVGFVEDLSAAMLARSAFMTCAAETKLVEAPADPPPVELLRDEYASLAIPKEPGQQSSNFTYRAWELRWSKERGGGLIDYDEILYVEQPSYYISWSMGFFHGDGRPIGDRRDLDSFDFVTRSFGLDLVKSVPLVATSSELGLTISTLVARLNAGKDGRGDALRLLLGQWGENPILRDGLAALDPKKAGPFVIGSLAILAASDLDDKRRSLFPKLHAYRDILVKLCPQIPDPAECEKILPEIEKRVLEGAFGET